MYKDKKHFFEWLLTEELGWIHIPHPSKADWFGIASIFLLFGQMPIVVSLTVILGSFYWFFLFIPMTASGWILLDWACYLE